MTSIGGRVNDPISADELRIVPANHATWQDLEAIFGTADYPFHCQCQRFKVTGWLWRDTALEERLDMHRASTACGEPDAEHSSGLVAYLDDEPVGWVAVEPRYRGRGITYPLARAAADYAREQGATAVEGYGMVTEPGLEITWGEVHVGAVQVFDEAGFTKVSAPTKRRRVMRIDFT
jgi:GNAT superfamily N-acetyltransferase